MSQRRSKLEPQRQEIYSMKAEGRALVDIARHLKVPVTTLKSFLASEPPAEREHADRPSHLDLLEQEVRDLRTAANRQRKLDVHDERVIQSIELALASVTPFYRDPDLTLPIIPGVDEGAHHRHMVLLSDFHGGEVVNRRAVNGLNSYDWQTMEDRLDEVFGAMLSHKKNSPALSGIDVLFLGDMCSGSNHEELAVTNQFPLAEQGVKIGYVMGQFVERLVPHYPDIRVLAVPGNHPRLVKKPAAKNIHDNMDWVAALVAKEYLKGYETVTMEVPMAASAFWSIAGRTCYVWHGDGIRSAMPGVPWGGVMRYANQVQSDHADVRIDHFILGHYHQPNDVQGGRILMNGSLKGTDEWTKKMGFGNSRPTQLLVEFDEKRSRKTATKYLTPEAGL